MQTLTATRRSPSRQSTEDEWLKGSDVLPASLHPDNVSPVPCQGLSLPTGPSLTDADLGESPMSRNNILLCCEISGGRK